MNYKSMTQRELKQHLLENRNDFEALRELKSRPKQASVTIPAHTSREEAERILRETIGEYLDMTKPDFNTIPLKEFRNYLKKNRSDRDAWDIYMERLDRETTKVSFPCPNSPEDIEIAINSNTELKTKFGI